MYNGHYTTNWSHCTTNWSILARTGLVKTEKCCFISIKTVWGPKVPQPNPKPKHDFVSQRTVCLVLSLGYPHFGDITTPGGMPLTDKLPKKLLSPSLPPPARPVRITFFSSRAATGDRLTLKRACSSRVLLSVFLEC
jgi:hypothetical protein